VKISQGENWFWLAGSNVGQASPGHFFWTDGTAVEYETWQLGEPNAFASTGRQMACVDLHVDFAGLFDFDCAQPLSVMCQVPQQLVACL
jgi:hypothetical protein